MKTVMKVKHKMGIITQISISYSYSFELIWLKVRNKII